jgi:hypothetical protein
MKKKRKELTKKTILSYHLILLTNKVKIILKIIKIVKNHLNLDNFHLNFLSLIHNFQISMVLYLRSNSKHKINLFTFRF